MKTSVAISEFETDCDSAGCVFTLLLGTAYDWVIPRESDIWLLETLTSGAASGLCNE